VGTIEPTCSAPGSCHLDTTRAVYIIPTFRGNYRTILERTSTLAGVEPAIMFVNEPKSRLSTLDSSALTKFAASHATKTPTKPTIQHHLPHRHPIHHPTHHPTHRPNSHPNGFSLICYVSSEAGNNMLLLNKSESNQIFNRLLSTQTSANRLGETSIMAIDVS
jgi:hypothetical protein